MKYGSVCSGVEAASLAWEPLGWQPQWFSEIDKFPSAVLQHHWPDVPNLGDMTSNEFRNNATPVDLIVGGTPCQSFSVAGLRKGLDDQNGNLALEFCRLIDRATPKWFVWENVPGVLSSNKGKDFGSIVGAMAEIGYNVAWRILDAQHFGTPQRRRRIFLIGHIGADGRQAAAVLFDSHSLQGHSAPSQNAQQAKTENVAPPVTDGPPFSRAGNQQIANALIVVAETVGPVTARKGRNAGASNDDVTADHLICVNAREDPIYLSGKDLPLGALDRGHAIATPMQVRRLTPRECERLQGMPDDHTRIPWRNKPAEDCPDTPRYKAIGNSMAVPVMRWIGQRIDFVETIYNE
jgi:DNA (cytosine-5)-methyltransferase 1